RVPHAGERYERRRPASLMVFDRTGNVLARVAHCVSFSPKSFPFPAVEVPRQRAELWKGQSRLLVWPTAHHAFLRGYDGSLRERTRPLGSWGPYPGAYRVWHALPFLFLACCCPSLQEFTHTPSDSISKVQVGFQ